MQAFTETIHIDRPPEAVWPFLIDTEKLQQWVNFESIEQQPDGPVEKGTRWHQTLRFLGKRMEMTDEVIEFEEGRRIALRSIDAPVSYRIEQRLDADERGTTVTFDAEAADPSGFFGRIAEPILVKLFARDVQAQLDRLKTLVEL